MVKNCPEASGPNNSRKRSCEDIQEGDQALSHRGRSKKHQQPLWSDRIKISFLISSLAIRRMVRRQPSRASRHPRRFKALWTHQQKLPVFPSGGLPLAQAGQSVESEGVMRRTKHFSIWHVLAQDMQNCILRSLSLLLTYLLEKHICELGIIFISD